MTATRTFLVGLTIIGAALALGAVMQQEQQPPAQPDPGTVRGVACPLPFPTIGNVDLVRQWRFGRIQSVESVGAGPDVVIQIRTADGQVHRTIGPRVLAELARQSNWVSSQDKSRPTRNDYVERMIAFDIDENQRIIAMMSLEPVGRDESRMRRAFGPR